MVLVTGSSKPILPSEISPSGSPISSVTISDSYISSISELPISGNKNSLSDSGLTKS